MAEKTVTFTKERDTKNTVKFAEDQQDGQPPVIASLYVQKWFAGLTGGTPQLTPDLVEIYRHDWAYRSDRAERELGYTWRTLETGLGETLAWLKESGAWR